MTVRQLHYTSCEDGLEGISGFQVSAMTPGIPRPLVDLAVRSSGYEAGPALVAHLGDGDVTRFPIAFGYVPGGDAVALFQSRYAGCDFTGRTGNYFAHALLLDDPERDLAGLLPIDLWRSPAWVDRRPATGTELPGLPGLAAGTATATERTGQFLSEPDRVYGLRRLLSAVQPLLASGRGRLVLTVPDDSAAAMWLAALSRSLPRALSLRVSFTTYTSRPENQEVMVSCVTPDVQLPAYGNFTVLDLTTRRRDGEATRYASVMANAWLAGRAEAAIRLAEQLDPPLTGAELDAFAVAFELNTGQVGTSPADERLLLAAVTLGMDRQELTFSADAWQRVSDQIQDTGGPRDLTGWSTTLQAALRRGAPVPATLLGIYLVAVLTAPGDAGVPGWLPRLDAADLGDVAENVVLPAVTDDQPPVALLRRLGGQPDLCGALARALDRRLTEATELERLATTLPPELVSMLPRPTTRVAMLCDLILARNGSRNRVQMLSNAARADLPHWRHLGRLLWPGEVTAGEAAQLLRSVWPTVLDDTGLAARVVEQIVRDQDPVLIDELLRSPLADRLSAADRAALMAVQLAENLREATPKRNADRELAKALDVLALAPPVLANRLSDSMAGFVLRAQDPAQHTVLLEQALTPQFLDRYRERARTELAKAAPDRVAAAILAWEGLSDARVCRSLVEKTLPAALSRRRTRYLDKVGTNLAKLTGGFGGRSPKRSRDWAQWWLAWRINHERRGLFGLLRRKAK